jgi:CheY-like chemotaxis protein
MAKILLVEDDKSLREIYGVRLMAEGYEIVSAGDGEEALALAIKERPSLIVSDVMMPKISGFDMLDILRSTSETKDVKVIMMTALSSDDQRARGESLGADRYLVKSQVGIEDVVRTVHDVLGDGLPGSAPAPAAPAAPAPQPAPEPTPAPQQIAPAPAPAAEPQLVIPTEPVTPQPQPVAPTSVVAPQPQPAMPAPAPVALDGVSPQPVAAPVPPSVPQPIAPAPAPVAPQPAPQPVVPPTVIAPAPVAPTAPAAQQFMPPVASQFAQPAPAAPTTPVAPASQPVAQAPQPSLPQPTAPFSTPAPASLGERVIQPLTPTIGTEGASNIGLQMEQALNGNTSTPQTPGQPPVA